MPPAAPAAAVPGQPTRAADRAAFGVADRGRPAAVHGGARPATVYGGAGGRDVSGRAESIPGNHGGPSGSTAFGPTTSVAPISGPAPGVRPAPFDADPPVPQQRGHGTVYGRTGGYPAIDMTMPVSQPLENSGSLTGHILAQGWHDTTETRKNGNAKVVVIMLLVILGLIGLSVLFLVTVGDAVSDLFRGVFGG
jgi:hypothetical protein